MSEIRAFVGHSFLDRDADVVRTFLAYLDQVRGVVPGFSWEHARKAEPKVLAEKVAQLFEDKNLFIGICTQREAVFSFESMRTPLLRRGKSLVNRDDVESKTSDWIIQEVGYALGRKMKVLLLLEDGVRKPGGLQGDLEYIQFSRKSPEQSFGQILEMIEHLLPGAYEIQASPVAERSEGDANEAEAFVENGDVMQPREDWTWEQYDRGLFIGILQRDDDAVKRIDDSFKASNLAEDPGLVAAWIASKEYHQIVMQRGGKLQKLEDLTALHEENPAVHKYLGLARSFFDQDQGAADSLLRSAALENDPQESFQRLGQAAESLAKSGDQNSLREVLDSLRERSTTLHHGQSKLTNILCNVAEALDDDLLWLGLSEYFLHLYPDQNSHRFDLAYKYSELNQKELSLKHYTEIPVGNRGGMGWNNLGVQFARTGHPYSAVLAYSKAESAGETLASSNLAFSLIQAGFLSEAKQKCDDALKQENSHKNIVHALARIKDVPDEEQESIKEMIEENESLQEFMVKLGESAFHKLAAAPDGTWTGPACDFNIKVRHEKFAAIGEYQVDVSALGNALVGRTLQSSEKRTFRLTYQGSIFGRAIFCTAERDQIAGPKPSGLLSGAKEEPWTALMVISKDTDLISICENPLKNNRRFIELRWA